MLLHLYIQAVTQHWGMLSLFVLGITLFQMAKTREQKNILNDDAWAAISLLPREWQDI